MGTSLFQHLYDYSDKNGVVIPDYTEIKADIQAGLKRVFGDAFSVEDETPNGVLIDSLTIFGEDVLGVCAQNANNFNPRTAGGAALDAIGEMHGVGRHDGEGDASFRRRILGSNGFGKGYVQNVREAVASVPGVTHCTVLENNKDSPAFIPNGENGTYVAGHSIYVSVGADDWTGEIENRVAEAIYGTKSAGCGYSQTFSGGVKTVREVEDPDTHTTTSVVFYKTQVRYVKIEITVSDANYVGTDIKGDVASALESCFAENSTNTTITGNDVVSYVALLGSGISVKSVQFSVSDAKTDPMEWTAVESVKLFPYMSVSFSTDDLTVNVV